MEINRNNQLLFNWIFIGNLLILALNDHILKWTFSNWLTGKISDFSGLLIFPLFIQFLIPRLKPLVTVIFCGLFFIFWKLPVSESFINLYNKFSLIPITRTVDYSDLIALSTLPLSYFIINNVNYFTIVSSGRAITLNPLYLLVPSCFIFIATSPPISYYMEPGGDIHIGKSYRIKVSKEVILQRLEKEGYIVRPDSSSSVGSVAYYLIKDVKLNGGRDTLNSIQIGFKGKYLLVNNVCLSKNFKVSDWKTLKRYTEHYRSLIQSEIIEEVK